MKNVDKNQVKCRKKENPLNTFKFHIDPYIQPRRRMPHREVPKRFEATPDTLVELSGNVCRKLPLPDALWWSNIDVLIWIASIGYPQYQNTLYENFINGHKLIFLEASPLCAINIKDFSHIQEIAEAIRQLYGIEWVKYFRSISLPPRYPWSHFVLYKGFTGTKYHDTEVMELFRKMKLIRPPPSYDDHWKILEKWLKHLRPDEYDIIGYTRRRNLYAVKKAPPPCEDVNNGHTFINCKICKPPPCDYFNTDAMLQISKRLSFLQKRVPTNRDKILELAVNHPKGMCAIGSSCRCLKCDCCVCKCMPPCTYIWREAELSIAKNFILPNKWECSSTTDLLRDWKYLFQ